MLQQILRDMYVDPDLLSELDEEQKQILFCKMREEQIRRWKEREEKLEKEEKEGKINKKVSKKGGRQVGFLNGKDGQPWIWIMGEHPGDKSIDQILEEEAQNKARNLAEHEAAATLRKLQEEDELANKLQSQSVTENEKKKVVERLWKQNILWTETSTDSPKVSSQPEPKCPNKTNQAATVTVTQPDQKPKDTNLPLRKNLNPNNLNPNNLNPNMVSCVNSVKEKRSSEIFASLKMDRQKSIDEAEKQTQKIHNFWVEQERRAKQEEEKQRLLAKKAREDHRRMVRKLKTESQIIGTFTVGQFALLGSKPTPGAKPLLGRPSRPSSKEDVIKWYREAELPKGSGLDAKTKKLADYFHGMITRERADSLLNDRPVGSFLIRLSDKIWGYGLSRKAEDKEVKHYLIDASPNGYSFFGTNQPAYSSLAEFVTNYQTKSICLMEKQLLQFPCPRDAEGKRDCDDLIKPTNSDSEVSYL